MKVRNEQFMTVFDQNLPYAAMIERAMLSTLASLSSVAEDEVNER